MKKQAQPGKHKGIKVVIVLLLAVLVYLMVTMASIVSFSEKDETRAADAAVVLGASVYDNSPSPVFCERINHAVDMYNDGYVEAIIMTGGVGEGNIRSEADIAREYAEQQGVPSEDIYIEEESKITAENLENARPIMLDHGMDSALIVSDPLHMKRAMLYAHDLGMTAYSSPTPTTLYRSWKTKLPFLVREEFYYIAYLVVRLFKMSFTINVIVIILEIIGLYKSISDRKWTIFAYYTQISNIITLISSIVLVTSGTNTISVTLRYVSSCMLTMTFLITLFVLVPMGGAFKRLMLSGNGLYHHTLCPILSVWSYIFYEAHSTAWVIPTIITFVYGIVMLIMNAKGKFDGPYPFFRVHNQSKTATVIWMCILTGVIAVISIVIGWFACNLTREYYAGDIDDYDKLNVIEIYQGDLNSDLMLFPNQITAEKAEYEAHFKPNLFDADGYMVLECSYDEEQFADEISRLKGLSKTIVYEDEQYTNEVLYDEDSYRYPAYITNDGFGNTYEYALIDQDQKKIAYIYMAYPGDKLLKKYSDYVKKDLTAYDEENTLDAYSMYNHSFDGGESWVD